MMKITICGGGNAAHVAAGLASARQQAEVNVYLPFAEEEQKWQKGISEQGGITVRFSNGEVTGRPARISSDPAQVIPGSELVLLALPAFAHAQVLKDLAPYIQPGAALGAMPARGGFDWSVKSCLGKKFHSLAFFGLQTLPWACRIDQYGQSVQVKGTKDLVEIAAAPSEQAAGLAVTLEEIFGLSLQPVNCFLCLTLANTGQLLHPGLMYGLFHGWQGDPYPNAPLFYQGVSPESAAVLEQMSGEVILLREALTAELPCLDFSVVRPLLDWLYLSYNGSIANPASLQSSLATNSSYAGLTAPMLETEAGLLPDFKARYLSEDVPYGLMVTRGLAELAGVQTPVMDEVITWSQERLGLEFLKDGKLRGKDLRATRAPQRYGINTLDILTKNRQA
jgi:hypothetical protein